MRFRTPSLSLGRLAAKPKRGEVWWVQLDPTRGAEIAKTRPCIVLTSDVVNTRRNTVVVVPLSSSPLPKPPLLVGVRTIGRPAVAVTDQIRAVTKERFQQKLGDLSPAEMTAI